MFRSSDCLDLQLLGENQVKVFASPLVTIIIVLQFSDLSFNLVSHEVVNRFPLLCTFQLPMVSELPHCPKHGQQAMQKSFGGILICLGSTVE